MGLEDRQQAFHGRAGLRRWCRAARALTVPLGRLDVLQSRWVALNDTNHLSPAATPATSQRCGAVRVSRGVDGRAGVRGRSALLTDHLSKYHGSPPPGHCPRFTTPVNPGMTPYEGVGAGSHSRGDV